MPQNRLVLGDWNAICDCCGFKFKASELRKDWRGLMVCAQDYEPKHPQLMIRIPKDDPSVPWARPQGIPEFIEACFPWTSSGYADMGSADCMRADNNEYTYAELLIMRAEHGGV